MTPRAALLWWLAALFAWLPAPAQSQAVPDAVLRLRTAQVLVEPYQDGLAPPDAADPRWRSIPTTERQMNPAQQLVRAWMRFEFWVDGPVTQPWAVLFPRIYTGGSVFLNGEPIGDVPGTSPSAQANWLRPHQFALSISSLQPGTNTLLVAMPSRYAQIGIGVPVVGPQTLIQPLYAERLFWEYTLALVSVWLQLGASFCLLAIWLWRRQEVLYGLFGMASLGWAIHTLHHVWSVIPLPLWVAWRTVFFAGTGFGIVMLCMFVLRASGLRSRWGERLALAYAASGPLSMLVLGARFEYWEVPWYGGAMALIGGTAIITLRYAWLRRTRRALALLLPVATIFATFLHDYAVKASAGALGNVYIAHVVAPVVVLIMCLVMLVRFVQSLNRLENVNIELEQRVRAREADIRASHESLLRMELGQASAAERQRIMQDMHDGLGSQLLSSLAMVERGAAGQQEVAQVLRECIDDMRLVLDALSPDDHDMLSALGTLRYRMAPRLTAAGIALDWQINCPAEALALEPRHGLAVLRIVQESIANVFKHAQATRLSVAIDASDGALHINVADNGKGFSTSAGGDTPTGRGLAQMRKRAAAIGAALHISSSPAGTEIRLSKALA